jgi:hypothetical protein
MRAFASGAVACGDTLSRIRRKAGETSRIRGMEKTVEDIQRSLADPAAGVEVVETGDAAPSVSHPASAHAACAVTHADAVFCISHDAPGPVMLGWLAPVVLLPQRPRLPCTGRSLPRSRFRPGKIRRRAGAR